MNDLIDVVGKLYESSEVAEALGALAPTRVYESPPFRRYIGSPQNGVDLLFENDRVISVQIYLKAVSGFNVYRGPLPFGLQSVMRQSDVHRILGQPAEPSDISSDYVFPTQQVRIVVSYDADGVTFLLSIMPFE